MGKENSEDDAAALSDANDHDLDFKMTPRMKVYMGASPFPPKRKGLLGSH